MDSIEELLKNKSLSDLKVIAGQNGLSRKIEAISIMDAPDSYKWLKGGEFILTTGFILGGDDWQLEHFLTNLIDAECAAVGIKKGRFLSDIPENVMQIANKNSFPIIEIPYSFGWSDIISVFYGMHLSTKEKPILSDVIPTNKSKDCKEVVYRDVLMKLCSGEVKSADIHKIEKQYPSVDTSLFMVAYTKTKKRDIAYNCFQNILRDFRLIKKHKCNLYIASDETEQITVTLIEFPSMQSKFDKDWQYALVEMIEYNLSEQDDIKISVGKIYYGINGIIKSYNEATEAYNIGKVILKDKCCLFYPMLAIYDALLTTDFSTIDFSYMDILVRYQTKFDFDAIECLEIYLDYGYKAGATKLFLHENTLRYRIQKISDLLHIDLRDNSICCLLLMQIKLWRLREMRC